MGNLFCIFLVFKERIILYLLLLTTAFFISFNKNYPFSCKNKLLCLFLPELITERKWKEICFWNF